MKKILLGTVVAVALLTGCTEEKKAPETKTEVTTTETKTQATTPAQETKKEETAPAAQTENK